MSTWYLVSNMDTDGLLLSMHPCIYKYLWVKVSNKVSLEINFYE